MKGEIIGPYLNAQIRSDRQPRNVEGKTRAQKHDKLRGNQNRLRMDVLPNEEPISSKMNRGPRPCLQEPPELVRRKSVNSKRHKGGGGHKPGACCHRETKKKTVGMRSWTVVSKAAPGKEKLKQRLFVRQ